jgi:hypothetical protein
MRQRNALFLKSEEHDHPLVTYRAFFFFSCLWAT